MAFIAYNNYQKSAFGVYNTRLEAEEWARGGAPEGYLLIVEYDWQETDYLPSMTVADDNVTMSNRFPGKTIAEQVALIEEEDDQKRIDIEIEFKTEDIKLHARELLRRMAWKETRARDTDLVNGNNNELTKYYSERNLVRTKSNQAETNLNALTTIEELRAFNTKEQFA
tara:strand:+ start:892 stop:1398 length:507 start_codon:yes stop_codon:yes gene_type:complete